MKVTCWGSIAYCCSPKYQCPNFFCVCEALGLDPLEVGKFKEALIERYLREKLTGANKYVLTH